MRVPHTPDFLWGVVGPRDFMRLSLQKAAHVPWMVSRTGNPGISPRCLWRDVGN
jgi:hypothetical protein